MTVVWACDGRPTIDRIRVVRTDYRETGFVRELLVDGDQKVDHIGGNRRILIESEYPSIVLLFRILSTLIEGSGHAMICAVQDQMHLQACSQFAQVAYTRIFGAIVYEHRTINLISDLLYPREELHIRIKSDDDSAYRFPSGRILASAGDTVFSRIQVKRIQVDLFSPDECMGL